MGNFRRTHTALYSEENAATLGTTLLKFYETQIALYLYMVYLYRQGAMIILGELCWFGEMGYFDFTITEALDKMMNKSATENTLVLPMLS
jgi:hypothetical protein